ncbi:hypothetical protein BD289DRAFT_443937 [Coniella lustricola]|uniref:Uncharacterized protein n=1 Tax=Coniella lustricola TaxID=2025994 RepID=A0A2T2ZWG3_9PEZI|nr:hypothetical protein BD289DRAFT_443937 [Coniella lustricola]
MSMIPLISHCIWSQCVHVYYLVCVQQGDLATKVANENDLLVLHQRASFGLRGEQGHPGQTVADLLVSMLDPHGEGAGALCCACRADWQTGWVHDSGLGRHALRHDNTGCEFSSQRLYDVYTIYKRTDIYIYIYTRNQDLGNNVFDSVENHRQPALF